MPNSAGVGMVTRSQSSSPRWGCLSRRAELLHNAAVVGVGDPVRVDLPHRESHRTDSEIVTELLRVVASAHRSWSGLVCGFEPLTAAPCSVTGPALKHTSLVTCIPSPQARRHRHASSLAASARLAQQHLGGDHLRLESALELDIGLAVVVGSALLEALADALQGRPQSREQVPALGLAYRGR